MSKHSPLTPSLEPVKHLSLRLQRKLVKREQRQHKRFRSSGKPYPLVMDMPGTREKRFGPAWASSWTTGQRLVLAMACLVLLMLVTFALVGIAAATHAANGIGLLLLVVVALLACAAIIIKRVVNRKP